MLLSRRLLMDDRPVFLHVFRTLRSALKGLCPVLRKAALIHTRAWQKKKKKLSYHFVIASRSSFHYENRSSVHAVGRWETEGDPLLVRTPVLQPPTHTRDVGCRSILVAHVRGLSGMISAGQLQRSAFAVGLQRRGGGGDAFGTQPHAWHAMSLKSWTPTRRRRTRLFSLPRLGAGWAFLIIGGGTTLLFIQVTCADVLILITTYRDSAQYGICKPVCSLRQGGISESIHLEDVPIQCPLRMVGTRPYVVFLGPWSRYGLHPPGAWQYGCIGDVPSEVEIDEPGVVDDAEFESLLSSLAPPVSVVHPLVACRGARILLP